MGQASNANDPDEFLWSHEGIKPRPGEKVTIPTSTPAPAPADAMEQRRYPRIDLKVPVLYRVMGEEPVVASQNVTPPTAAAQADNISVTGACLVLAERLPKGIVLHLTIHLPEERQKITAVARVVWSEGTDVMHHFLTGLEFISLYKKTRSGNETVTSHLLQKILHKS